MRSFADHYRGRRAQRRTVEIAGALSLATLALSCGPGPTPENVLTYKYDNYRTGWNNTESTLTTTNVSSTKFGLLLPPVSLDDQVDTQPLVLTGLATVNGQATNGDDVVYVTTESNTVYAIDGATGAILASRNLGKPVSVPLGCNNNGPNVGINGTGVIDQASNTFYVITYTNEGGTPTYRIHALDVTTLADKVSPPVITASHAIGGGGTFTFNASVQRQRPALLAENGNVYAGFGSFCDFKANISRGWVLGWKQGTLAPLPANQVPDTKATSSGTFFLSSVWMSGSGLAADGNGDIFVVVGNTGGGAYDGSGGTNFSESVIKLSPDLTKVLDWFTPTNVNSLDGADLDFGSGGVLVVPGKWTANYLAAATGKVGTMFVLNSNNLGHGPPGGPSPTPLASPTVGYCWCNESYFFDANLGPVIVSSGGGNGQGEPAMPETIQLWAVQKTGPLLTNAGKSADLSGTGQDGGFFTAVSGYGPNAIIWAVLRPDGSNTMRLLAFSEHVSGAGTLTQLFSGNAGTWPNQGGNANIVPVVANGRVYVATYKQLAIFGLH